MNHTIRYMWTDNRLPLRMKKPTSCIVNLHKAVTTSALIIGMVIFIFYYNMFNLINFYEIEKPIFDLKTTIQTYNDTDYILNTAGCVIPNFSKTLKFKEAEYKKKTCGDRGVFVNKIADNKIKFDIQYHTMKRYSKGKPFNCCYKFAYRSTEPGKEDTEITYSTCKTFKTGTIIDLEQEVLTVNCKINSGAKHIDIYEDAYLLLKKLNTLEKISNENEESWNVLIVGMDTMSRARAYATMPQTVTHFHKHKWLDFRGYQKVGFNTFPNIMAVLTGKKMSSVYKACAKGMTYCNDFMMWHKFEEAGYVTAYGEEYLNLPDTFSRYKGFNVTPTHHYTRPFFLTGEEKSGNYICTGRRPSALHLLDYAIDFVNTYDDVNFFGMFWLNSFSHNFDNKPALIDKDMVHFFDRLVQSSALNNTFIIFLSDHGIRYGEMRLPIESYYEERLPMFFMHVPYRFQELYFNEYNNLKTNQDRLTTPYDFHLTMSNILKLSNDSVEIMPSEACLNCSSLFYEKPVNRTCADAGVTDKWCSCHNMVKANESDPYVQKSLDLAVSYIQNITKTIETDYCMLCENLKLKTVLRHHFYVDDGRTFYIVAFLFVPGDVAFEANLMRDGNEISIVGPIETISAYNTRGNCVKKPNDRSYCVCKKDQACYYSL
ncbi:PREDICTED: uncharacterized protein LOC106128213 [Papilio xuthus]|uniref:Uncharacterized protein LOC106128213 n=1 Tax=Papilio xuthus TaxID=66420 RepID=A0AAJ6ZYE5_PAPXU|nr:PREDICTED: uncharacterized protein LOC106128213 [Papilio xuthus]